MDARAAPAVHTTCPYCGVGCGIRASVSEVGVDIAGDPDHPSNFGRLCSKGAALGETVAIEDRLLHPEIGGERADWNAALDKVATTFRQTIDAHGPDSVAFYVSGQLLTEDYYVANKLMKGYIGSANIDTNSRLCMASSVAGHRRAFGADTVPGVYADLEEADLIVLVGSNLAWCHPVLHQRLAAARERRPSMRVVAIDPRRTVTVNACEMEAGRDKVLHLAINSGTDLALFNALFTYIADKGWVDQALIDDHTSGFQEAVAGNRTSIEQAAEITGLAPADIVKAAEWIAIPKEGGARRRSMFAYEKGLIWGNDNYRTNAALVNIALATGNIGREGGGCVRMGGHQEGYARPSDAHVGRPAAYVDQLLIGGQGGVHHIWGCDHYKTTLNALEFKRRYKERTDMV